MTGDFRKWEIDDDSGKPILSFKSFISMDLRSGGNVVSVPIENGSFASYNKTQMPLDINCVLAYQGTPDELQLAIYKLAHLKHSISTFSLVTPEYEYRNLTLESYSFDRKKDNGVNLIVVTMKLKEVAYAGGQGSELLEKLSTRKKTPLKAAKRSDVAAALMRGVAAALAVPVDLKGLAQVKNLKNSMSALGKVMKTVTDIKGKIATAMTAVEKAKAAINTVKGIKDNLLGMSSIIQNAKGTIGKALGSFSMVKSAIKSKNPMAILDAVGRSSSSVLDIGERLKTDLNIKQMMSDVKTNFDATITTVAGQAEDALKDISSLVRGGK